jgi:lysozyme
MSNTSEADLTPSTTLLSLVEADLRRHEGVRSKPYKDTEGILSIGVGHNLEAEGLCPAAIQAQLSYDIETKALNPLERFLPWWKDQPIQVQRALINLCFNLGIGSLTKFQQTLSSIKKGDYRKAAAQLLQSKYAQQVKGRAIEVASWISSAQDLPKAPVQGLLAFPSEPETSQA